MHQSCRLQLLQHSPCAVCLCAVVIASDLPATHSFSQSVAAAEDSRCLSTCAGVAAGAILGAPIDTVFERTQGEDVTIVNEVTQRDASLGHTFVTQEVSDTGPNSSRCACVYVHMHVHVQPVCTDRLCQPVVSAGHCPCASSLCLLPVNNDNNC